MGLGGGIQEDLAMTVQLSTPIQSEILSPAELTDISGRSRKDDQITWLRANGWQHAVNAAGHPIVGRWYARMKLAGVELSETFTPQIAMPDFSKVK
jgi:hypothetical protein